MMELDPGPSPAVAVIGAAGFIGRPLCARLAATGGGAVAVVRQKTDMPAGVEVRASGSLSPTTDWTPLLRGTDRLVYLASRAHAALPAAAIEAWIAAEAATVAACARAAAAGGIDRIILMSSIKVLGEATEATAFTADTPPAPRDAYGRAKWAMEQAISGPSVTVIRPPLVYGPGVKANFKALLRLVDKGLPLPLASVANRRSLVALDNLIDLVLTALTHPAAPGGTFLVHDGEDISTPELLRRLARHLDRPSRLFPFPPALLHLAARIAGRADQAERLLGSLCVDDSATRRILGWRPPVSVDDGLAATCRWYRGTEGHEPASARSR